MNEIICGDCLSVMPTLPENSVDMIFCDLPYGTTACSWDTIIPFEPLWAQYRRVIKDHGAIVLTASQPFTSKLVMSAPDLFKYSWIYKKRCASNFAQAKYAPMKEHEDILIFAKGKVRYYPIKEARQGSGVDRVKYSFSDATRHKSGEFVGAMNGEYDETADELRYPSSVQEFNNRAIGDRGLHPTQKPVALCQYFIKTYTNEGDVVLDNCMGSGTTGIACILEHRDFIGIEIDAQYAEIARKRIADMTGPLFIPPEVKHGNSYLYN